MHLNTQIKEVMTSVRLMLNKCRMLKKGNFPLVFQLIHNREKRLIGTGCKLKEQEFNESSGKVIRCADSVFSDSEAIAMNRKLLRLRKKIDGCIKQMTLCKDSFTVTDLVDCIMCNDSFSGKQHVTLLQYIRLQVAQKEELGKDGTAAAYNSTFTSLGRYVAAIYPRRKDVKLTEVDVLFVRGYERYLFQNGVADNTASYYLRNFRTLYNRAVAEVEGLSNVNPFKYVRTRPCRTVKRALTRQQLQAIAGFTVDGRRAVEFSRDLYLFSFYAQGMSFVDIVYLKKENIQGGLLTYKRHKSGQLIHILITPQMQVLMDKYKGGGEFVFPIINSSSPASHYRQYRLALARINRHLAYIANRLAIDVPLTTYTARHTWATLAHYCGAPISAISAGLGHTSEEMTRVYLKEFDVSLLAEVNKNVTKLIQAK